MAYKNLYIANIKYKENGSILDTKTIIRKEKNLMHKFNKEKNNFDKIEVTEIYDLFTNILLIRSVENKVIYQYKNKIEILSVELDSEIFNKSYDELLSIKNSLNASQKKLELRP